MSQTKAILPELGQADLPTHTPSLFLIQLLTSKLKTSAQDLKDPEINHETPHKLFCFSLISTFFAGFSCARH
ncbi:hypothetical protein DSO57_1004092 [Entomophthora muscae]|uniref:Uncharacterized protein n=1 Tax=Entomophthora muscae TaxID=34485 RepID=A0ACC2SX76_9FUNG|nr:hypothetical protein DSO57_1004092 [Entomophthora muscae]